jgi:hypothetical protein
MFALALPAWAFDYYVSDSGSDVAPGSLLAPFKTIQRGVYAAVNAGDTVHVRAGIYKERVSMFGKTGTAGAPITLQAYEGETAVLDLSGVAPVAGLPALLLIRDCSYISIKNLELRNYKTSSDTSVPVGILLSGSGTGVEIIGNRIHGIWQSNTGIENYHANAHGLLVSGDRTTPITNTLIEGNEIFDLRLGASEALVLNGNVDGFVVRRNVVRDCNNLGIDFIGGEGTVSDPALDRARNGLCTENLVYNIDTKFNPVYRGNFGDGGGNDTRGAAGIYVDAATNIIIERNHVHHCNFGIEVGSEHVGITTSGITVRNNLLRHNHVAGIYIGSYAASLGGVSNCTFTHNTLYQNDTEAYGGGSFALQYNVSNVIIQHNIIVCANTGYKPFILNTTTLGSVPAGSIDWNVYSGAPSNALEFKWRDFSYTSFAAWRSGSGHDANSLFVSSVGFANASRRDFSLQATSPAVDQGNPSFLPASGEADLAGKSRLHSGSVDIGALEFGALPAAGPEVTTVEVEDILYTSATLAGSVTPGASAADVQFQYGTSPALSRSTPVVTVSAGIDPVILTAPITGLLPRTTYYYRIVGTNGTGTNPGALFSFVTPPTPPPGFPTPPIAVLVAVGEDAVVSASPTGGVPMTFQWRKNGKSIAGATTTSHTIDSVTTADAATYTLAASNVTATVVSPPIPLGVVTQQPSTSLINEGATLTLKATATAPPGFLSYQWTRNAVDLVDDHRIKGATSSTLTVKFFGAEDPGVYQCEVRVGNQQRNCGAHTVTVRLKPIMDSFLPSTSWIVSGPVNETFTASTSPTSFKATGLPPGLKLDPKTGVLSGRPTAAGDFLVYVTATNEAGTGPPMLLVAYVSPLPGLTAGSFAGIVGRADLFGQRSLGGQVSFTISTAGIASGSLTFGTVTKKFTAPVNTVVALDTALTAPIPLGTGQPTLRLSLTIEAATGEVSGTLTDPANLSLPAIPIETVRSPWDARSAPATDYQGSYTVLLQPGAPAVGDSRYPQGVGYASIMISPAGIAQVIGFLADGSPLSCSAPVDAEGEFPVFSMSQSNLGSVLGWLGVNPLLPGRPISGSVGWFRNASAPKASRNYATGIPLHSLSAVGSLWEKLAAADAILGLPALPASAVIRLAAATPELQQPFTLSEAHVPTVPANAQSVTLKLNTSSGLYSGSFVLRDPPSGGSGKDIVRSITYSGAILRQQDLAQGFFLVPGLPDPQADPVITAKNSPLTSGKSMLLPSP